ncbi:hypothetical protein, variant [Exophiala sideris]|uniref:Uncharacterized protein n=1 Tax=Exophiala sideris TaxID=1016849 RepID=A0A0D1W4X6_9EURO|nr:hypothetical protein PV11_05737 [Exophiala sideris]KIV83740.1 hypothetical protein, variant [Exophiala sideris]
MELGIRQIDAYMARKGKLTAYLCNTITTCFYGRLSTHPMRGQKSRGQLRKNVATYASLEQPWWRHLKNPSFSETDSTLLSLSFLRRQIFGLVPTCAMTSLKQFRVFPRLPSDARVTLIWMKSRTR